NGDITMVIPMSRGMILCEQRPSVRRRHRAELPGKQNRVARGAADILFHRRWMDGELLVAAIANPAAIGHFSGKCRPKPVFARHCSLLPPGFQGFLKRPPVFCRSEGAGYG